MPPNQAYSEGDIFIHEQPKHLQHRRTIATILNGLIILTVIPRLVESKTAVNATITEPTVNIQKSRKL
jgi:hypothetical protein